MNTSNPQQQRTREAGQSGENVQEYGQQQQQIQTQPQPQVRRLTAEEMKAVRECNRESFYYRALPLSLAGMVGVRYLGSLGYLKPSPVYGYFWKYTGAVILGYFVGKFSYLGKCREKIMNLPNSELGDALRKSYGGGKRQFEVLQEMATLPDIGTSGGGEHGYAPMREDSDPYTSPDFQVRPNDPGGSPDQPAQKPSTTYDELRRRNREEFLRQQFGVGQPGSSQQQQQPPSHEQQQQQQRRPSQSYGSPQLPQKPDASKSSSKYGDSDFK